MGNYSIRMDYFRLESEVRIKSNEYLQNITEDTLKSLAESTKYIAQLVLENYFFEVDDLYSNGALKLEDQDKLNAFMDFQDGYRARMKKWIHENEIKIEGMEIPSVFYPEDCRKEDVIKQTVTIAGVGTLIAIGLLIFTKTWVAVAAELLTLGITAYSYKKASESNAQQYAFKIRQYELQIEKCRATLVNGLISDLKKWLENAEQYSKNILSEFGVQ